MKAGTVLFFKSFPFKDGGIKDKLLIILNTPKNDEPYLLCTTTSQQHRKKQVLGCHSNDGYYYIDEKQDAFLKNTWVMFHSIYAYQTPHLLSEKFKGRLSKQFELENTLWNAIKNCVLASEDIELDYLEIIQKSN